MAVDPVTAGFNFGEKVVGVISEWVEDKDLAAKLAFEVTKLNQAFSLEVLKTQTTPKVDALVKFAYAMRDVIIPLFQDVIIPLLRPVGSAAVTAFGVYAHMKGVSIDPTTHALLDAAFPGWMASRHAEKARKDKEETERVRVQSYGSEPRPKPARRIEAFEEDDFDPLHPER